MSSIPQVSEAMKKILTERASDLERPTGFVQRSTAQLRGAIFAQAVVFGLLANPQASYSQLRHVIGSLGVHVSRQAVEQRFDSHAVALVRQLFEEATGQVIQSEGRIPDLLARFAGVFLQDGTRISLPDSLAEQWPGSGGGNPPTPQGCLRVQVRLNYASGQWQGVWVQQGCEGEATGEAVDTPLPEGALWIVDSGYLHLARMRQMEKTGRFFLLPPRADLVFLDPSGVRCSLKELLSKQTGEWVDLDVKVGASEQLPVRLVAHRLSPEHVQERSKRRCQQHSSPPKGAQRPNATSHTARTRAGKRDHHGHRARRGHRTSPKQMELLDWTILMTNAPREKLSCEEVLVMARCRWQIELLWKWGKQIVKVDTWRSEKPERIVTEIFAKWLGMLITQWITLLDCWHDPRHSTVKAHQVVQWMAPVLALSLAGVLAVECAVERSAAAMRRGCQVQPRRKKPATFQLLEAPQLIKT